MFKRYLSLIAVLGSAIALVATIQIPKLQVGDANQPELVLVEPKQPQLVCPGPVFVNGGNTGLKLGSFTQSGLAAVSGIDGSKSILLSAAGFKTIDGQTAGSKSFNAIQTQRANQKLAAGLAATNCVPGENEAWFVAGDNSVGREALLILVNPSRVDATVSLQILGVDGLIQGTGLSGISAPAGKVTILPLAAFAPKVSTFAIKVSSRGAMLGMWLQQKTIRGLTPGGLDLVGQSPNAENKVLIPGLFIRGSRELAALSADSKDYEDTKTYLRVAAPGDKDATFTAQVQGANGSSFGTVIQGTVPAGTVRDFELTDLVDGNYVVQVTSDQPVLASARFNRVGKGEPDLAWAVAVKPSKLNAGFTTAPGSISKLSLANPGDKDALVTLNGNSYTVPAASNIVVTLSSGKSFEITSSVSVTASTVIDQSAAVAVVPVLDYRSITGKLKVTVR